LKGTADRLPRTLLDNHVKTAKSTAAAVPPWFWLGLIILVATLAAYWPVFSAGFIWDDDDYVTQNQALHDADGLRQIWFTPAATPQYYPLVHTTFWVEYHLWGLDPLGFHLVNVLLHATGAILLWRLLAGLKLPGAWLAAAVFALHPVQTESVAWITELKNVLSAVFYFSAALCYLRFAGLGEAAGDDRRRGRYYFAALFLFVAALLSKTVACSLPAALALVIWWKKDRLGWGDLLLLAPFFVLGAGLGLATAWLEKNHVGAAGADWSLTFADRGLIAGRALWFYAANLLWPTHLAFIYPRWVINARIWWQWLFPAAVAAVVVGLWLARKQVGKGPLVAVLFFCGTLLPALGFVNVYPMRFSFVADHFQYLASLGLIALAAGLAEYFFETVSWPGSRQLRLVLAGSLLCLLGVLTWCQCGSYRTPETLWRDTLARNPRSWMAHTNLGRLLAQRGEYAEAETHYLAALGSYPGEGSIHYNYANLLARTDRPEAAIEQYREALQIAPEKAQAHNNLGSVLNKLHRTDEAIAEYERAIFYDPAYADAYYNLGNALSAEHKMYGAVAAFQRAARLKPDSDVFRKRLQALTAPAQ